MAARPLARLRKAGAPAPAAPGTVTLDPAAGKNPGTPSPANPSPAGKATAAPGMLALDRSPAPAPVKAAAPGSSLAMANQPKTLQGGMQYVAEGQKKIRKLRRA